MMTDDTYSLKYMFFKYMYKCITLLLHFVAYGDLCRDFIFMDFIPIDCEPWNDKNRTQTVVENSNDVKKKRPVDDNDQVGRLVNFCLCRK